MIGKKHYRGIPKKVREEVMKRCDGQCEGIVTRYKEDGMCYAERVGVCGNQATEIAHIEPKRMGGSRLLDYELNLLALCTHCHNLLDGREHDDYKGIPPS